MRKVSCILCHHKGRLIDNAVKTIKESKLVETEIIVVTSDQSYVEEHSSDNSITVVFTNGGPAYKRNVGFRFSEHPYIAFFDDDIEVRPYAIDQMLLELDKDPSVGMVYGKLLNMEFQDKFDEAGSYLTWSGFLWARAESGILDHGQFEDVVPVLSGKSAACMIRRSIFGKIGMFDPTYEILAEETDLAWRVWLYGYKVLFVPSSVTLHAFNTKFKPGNFYTPKRVYFNGCRNYISMLMTNLSNLELIVPVTVQLVVWTMAGIGFLVTGKFEAGINVFLGLKWVFTHLDIILSKRKKVQSERVVKDSDLLPVIRRNPPLSYYINRFFHYIKTGRHG